MRFATSIVHCLVASSALVTAMRFIRGSIYFFIREMFILTAGFFTR
jgi:hypothetical protein